MIPSQHKLLLANREGGIHGPCWPFLKTSFVKFEDQFLPGRGNSSSWDPGLGVVCGGSIALTQVFYSVSVPLQISQHGGSSTSLSSTKVCSSMDENDGPGEGDALERKHSLQGGWRKG